MIRYFSIGLIYACVLCPINGQMIEWTGGGTDNKWHNAANWNLNTIPTENHSVLIKQSNVVIDDDALVKSVVVENAELFVNANYKLTIKNSSDVGLRIINSDFFTFGDTYIDKTVGHGVVVDIDSGLEIHSSMTIERINTNGSVAIDNQGLLSNEGDLFIRDVVAGINSSNGNLNTSGLLEIRNSTSYAISLAAGSILSNTGTLNLFNNDGLGLALNLSTQCNNRGLIRIDSLGHLAISNGGTFSNKVDGTIDISRIQSSAFGTGAIGSSGLFENIGLINISECDNICISSNSINSPFINTGTIEILNSSRGIAVSSKLVNESSGTIRLVDVELFPVNIADTLHNEGDIIIANCFGSAVFFNNSGFLDNSGSIMIDSSADNAISMSSGARIYNRSAGIINVTNVYKLNSFYSIGINFAGHFRNDGLVNVEEIFMGFAISNSEGDTVLQNGIISIANVSERSGMINNGYWHNLHSSLMSINDINNSLPSPIYGAIENGGEYINDGSIIISNSNSNGITNYANLVNNGSIAMSNIERRGLYLYQFSEMMNNQNGHIFIQNVMTTPLYNEQTAEFIGSGTLEILKN